MSRRYFEDDEARARRGREARKELGEPENFEEATPVEALVKAIRDGKPDAQQAVMEKFHTALKELKLRLDATIGVNDDNGKLSRAVSRIESLEASRRWLWGGLGTMFLIAVSSIGLALSAASNAGARDGRTDTRLDQLEHSLDKLGSQIEALWRYRTGGLP